MKIKYVFKTSLNHRVLARVVDANMCLWRVWCGEEQVSTCSLSSPSVGLCPHPVTSLNGSLGPLEVEQSPGMVPFLPSPFP